jgi:hypothetical protein
MVMIMEELGLSIIDTNGFKDLQKDSGCGRIWTGITLPA